MVCLCFFGVAGPWGPLKSDLLGGKFLLDLGLLYSLLGAGKGFFGLRFLSADFGVSLGFGRRGGFLFLGDEEYELLVLLLERG